MKANQALFIGTTTTGSISVIIKTSFSGSVGGISTLAANLTIGPGGSFTGGGGWLATALTPVAPVGAGGFPNGGAANVPNKYDAPITADAAIADCFQVSAPTIYRTPVLHDDIIGVVPFVFVASKGNAALGKVTNITSAQVKTAFVNGALQLSALSGNSGDSEAVLAVGRDEDSGTRIQALACSGIGIQTFLQQYQPLFDGASHAVVPPPPPGAHITGSDIWPPVTLNAINYPQGDSGYNSGGFLASAVNVSRSGTTFYGTWFISYLGISDAASVTNGIELAFNGVAYSAANVAGPGARGFVAQYTYWGYEHLFYRATYSGNGKTVTDQISSDLINSSAAVSGILLSAMHVSRDKDGARIELGGKPGN